MQVRVERPSRNFEAVVSFYRDVVGLPVLASFEDHGGYSGVVFGLTDASRQLELVFHEEHQPAADVRGPARTGAVCFLDPDGYSLVLSPEAW
jgi:catechol 2,3-dioxygenase-like lactoylglutathione lyase family enzyme